MKQTICAVFALLFIGLASIVPWSQAQQQASPVVIWCQDASGGTAPCLAGNSLDYDTGAGTVLQGTVGFVLPGSGGPVAGGTAANPIRIDPTGTTPQPVTGSVTVNAGTNLNTSALALESGGNLANAASGVGVTGDAAASPGSVGSLSAKLRLITTQLDNLLTELGQKTEPTNTQTIAGTVTANPGTAANWGIYAEDAPETASGNLSMTGSVRRDAAASSAGASGRNATLNTDALGLLWARQLDPCSGVAKLFFPINISTATTTEITPSLAGASNHYYVCSIDIGPVAGAQNLALVDDDTDNCVSVTSGLAGGTTAATGWNILAGGGLTMGNGHGSIARTGGTNRVLCLVSSAAVQTSGVITVVAAP